MTRMCTSKPKSPAPIPNAPVALPTSIDDEVLNARDESMRRRRGQYGRQSTLITGAMSGLPPTAPTKSALGT